MSPQFLTPSFRPQLLKAKGGSPYLLSSFFQESFLGVVDYQKCQSVCSDANILMSNKPFNNQPVMYEREKQSNNQNDQCRLYSGYGVTIINFK